MNAEKQTHKIHQSYIGVGKKCSQHQLTHIATTSTLEKQTFVENIVPNELEDEIGKKATSRPLKVICEQYLVLTFFVWPFSNSKVVYTNKNENGPQSE